MIDVERRGRVVPAAVVAPSASGLPAFDRVVMLRPTESSVVFLRQLGRVSCARARGERLRKLLSLGGAGRGAELRALLQGEEAIELPAGCSVEVELEAKEMLARIFKVGGADEVERAYRELRRVGARGSSSMGRASFSMRSARPCRRSSG